MKIGDFFSNTLYNGNQNTTWSQASPPTFGGAQSTPLLWSSNQNNWGIRIYYTESGSSCTIVGVLVYTSDAALVPVGGEIVASSSNSGSLTALNSVPTGAYWVAIPSNAQ